MVFDSAKIYIERHGKPNNFRNSDEATEAHRRIQVEQDIMAKALSELHLQTAEDGVEKELRKQKEAHTKK